MSKQILTIGYEGRSAVDVLRLLSENGVEVLLDIRLRPSSRKPGLSKSGLAVACKAAGIRYIHEKRLGTPPEMMEHVRSGQGYSETEHAAYRKYLVEKQEDALLEACGTAGAAKTCLLCFEIDPMNCHRRIVAEEMARHSGLHVSHL
jgi:uncharacterized protein (DUF488 family)